MIVVMQQIYNSQLRKNAAFGMVEEQRRGLTIIRRSLWTADICEILLQYFIISRP